MLYIISGALISIGVALTNFLKSFADNKKTKKENKTIIILLIFAVIGTLLTMSSAIESKISARDAKDSLAIKQKAVDSVNGLIAQSQTEIIHLQKTEIDSIRDLLQSAVTIIQLQKEVRHLQGSVFDEISGGNNWEQFFTSSVLMNDKTKLPVVANINSSDPDHIRLLKRQCDFADFARPKKPGENVFANIRLPNTTFEKQAFLLELLEYKIIVDLHNSGYRSEKIEFTPSRAKSTINLPYPLKSHRLLTGKEMRNLLKGNQFAKDTIQLITWDFAGIKLPKGATVETKHFRNDPAKKTQRIITIKKADYFTIDFILENSFHGTIGNRPKGIPYEESEAVLNSTPYYFSIVVKTHFFNTVDPEIIEYKKWARSVIDYIQHINED